MIKTGNLKDSTEKETIEERKNYKSVPIYYKSQLTVEEAAAYSGIGQHKIRELAKRDDADFALYCGRKLLIKRKRFDDYIDHELVI